MKTIILCCLGAFGVFTTLVLYNAYKASQACDALGKSTEAWAASLKELAEMMN